MKSLPLWRRVFHWKTSKTTMFMQALARMSDLDIAKMTEDALGYRLPQFEPSSSEPNVHSPRAERLDHSSNPQMTHINSSIPQPNTSSDTFVSSSNEAAGVQQTELELTSTNVDNSAKPQAQSRKLHPTTSANWAALRGAVSSKSRGGEQVSQLSTVQTSQENVFELQEVVIDSADTGTVTQHGKVHQRRSIGRRGSAHDSVSASDLNPTSSGTSNAGMPIKTIGLLALQQRGKGGARAFMAAIQKPIEAAGASSQKNISSVHVERSHIFPANVVDGCTAPQTSMPQPPPRSRSSSRIRASDTAGATLAPDPPIYHGISIARAPTLQQMPRASVSSLSTIRSLATSGVVATEPCGIPQPPPRSRSQSRIRASETASIEIRPSLHDHPRVAALVAHDDSDAQRVDSASNAQASAGAAARSVRSSKKRLSQKAPERGQPPPVSAAQRLQYMGAEYEEC